MWISKPTPVTTSSITAVSWSISSAEGHLTSGPTSIQVGIGRMWVAGITEHLDEHGDGQREADRRRGDGHPGRALPQGPGDASTTRKPRKGTTGISQAMPIAPEVVSTTSVRDRSAFRLPAGSRQYLSTSTDGGRRHRASRDGRRG
jgi:hypothetical protein